MTLRPIYNVDRSLRKVADSALEDARVPNAVASFTTDIGEVQRLAGSRIASQLAKERAAAAGYGRHPLAGFSCFNSSAAPASDYVRLVSDEVADGNGQYLFNIDEGEFIESNSVVSVATDLESRMTISGCHAVVDMLGVILLQGVVTRLAYRRRGIGRAVFANAIVRSAVTFNSSNFGLVVREFSDGPATEALAMYQSFGFEIIRREVVKIHGNLSDRHLLGEGEGADHFRVAVMAGDFETLRIAAQCATLMMGGSE